MKTKEEIMEKYRNLSTIGEVQFFVEELAQEIEELETANMHPKLSIGNIDLTDDMVEMQLKLQIAEAKKGSLALMNIDLQEQLKKAFVDKGLLEARIKQLKEALVGLQHEKNDLEKELRELKERSWWQRLWQK